MRQAPAYRPGFFTSSASRWMFFRAKDIDRGGRHVGPALPTGRPGRTLAHAVPASAWWCSGLLMQCDLPIDLREWLDRAYHAIVADGRSGLVGGLPAA